MAISGGRLADSSRVGSRCLPPPDRNSNRQGEPKAGCDLERLNYCGDPAQTHHSIREAGCPGRGGRCGAN